MRVRLREATPADAPSVTALWDEASRAGFEDLLPAGHELPRWIPERFEALLDDPTVVMLVAEEEDELRGFITFGASRDADTSAETGEVRSLFVAPAAWRSGVGSALLTRALEELPAMGHTEATVWSFADNGRANAFYERHGFRRDGAETREEVWAGVLEVRYRR